MTTYSKATVMLPPGIYSGEVGGYICKVFWNKNFIDIEMIEGVRGFGYRASVIVDGEGIAKIVF